MLLLPPANWGLPFNPTAPDADSEMVLAPVPGPKGPMPAGAVALMPPLEVAHRPLYLV